MMTDTPRTPAPHPLDQRRMRLAVLNYQLTVDGQGFTVKRGREVVAQLRTGIRLDGRIPHYKEEALYLAELHFVHQAVPQGRMLREDEACPLCGGALAYESNPMHGVNLSRIECQEGCGFYQIDRTPTAVVTGIEQ